MPSVEIPALLTEDIENPDIVDITEPISASITGTGPHTLVIDGQDIHAASSNTIVSGEATITLTSDVNVNAVTTSNLRTPSIHKIKVKTDEKYTFTYVPNSDVTASSVSSTTKTGTDFEILLITTIGGDKYLDLDLVDYTSPVATFSNALTGFNILDLSSFEFGSSAYGVTAKLYKVNGTLISTLPSVRAGSIVPFGTGAENTPQSAVDYKLEITDILGRISSYNMTREWNSYVISPIGFQKLTLGNEEITSSPGVLPNVPSLSSARIYPATNQGYIGINFIVQGQNNPSSSWVLVDDTPANVRADGSAEFIMFGNYSYHRIGVKPTAKTTVSVSDYNNVSVTFSDFTDESVTIPSLLTADPYSIDETTNTYTFVETSNIGVDTPYIVTLGSETYPNAFTATTAVGSVSSDTPSSTLDATTEVSDPILELYFTTALTSFPKNVKRYNISTHDDVLGVLFESFASKRKRVEKMINTNNFSMELTVINVLSPATQYISVANTVSGNKYGTGSGSGLTFGNYTTYSYQTGDQTIAIPSGKTHVKVILKGAGGGYGGTRAGGSGGYTEAEIELPSGTTSLTLIVGQGGDSTVNTSKTYGGGGGSGNDGSVTGGRGGGRTAVRIGGTEIATAGGGGGGCGQGTQTGGSGGGLIALGYSNPNGGGGTQTTGGSGGVGSVNSGQAGAQYEGGTGSYLSTGWGAAGGGGGWYGGGGGGGSGGNHGAGGGGSGFAGRNGSTVLSGNERGTSVAYADTTQRTDSVNGCKYKNVKILRGGGSAGQYSTTSTINHGVAEISWGQNTFEETPTFIFIRGQTYVFDQSDSTNATHPIRLSTTSDGTHASGSQYTSGWTTSGTPGNAGATSQFIVPANASSTLYYYCPNHSGMGGTINIASTPYLLTFGNFTLAANTQVSDEYAIAANYDGTTSNLYMDGDLITQTTPTIASGAKDFILGKEYSGYIKNFTFWNYVKDFSTTPEATPGQQVFTSSGTFTVPTGVTSLSCVVVGGGGGSTGCSGAGQYSGAGGGGGGLAYGTFSVSTGATVTVQVGVGGTAGTNVNNGTNVAGTGGESRITYNGTTIMLRGYGGVGGTYGINTNAAGGGFFISSQATLSGGGSGGYGSRGANNNGGGGGGGAGGYGGTGGNGGYGNGGAGGGGASGGGGGGGGQSIGGAQYNGGGGVGLEGQGSNGTGNSVNNPGGGGSGGASGGTAGVGGTYGGGAGGCEDDTNRPGSAGGAGGVRIIWGSGRSYPSTNTGDV